MKKLSLPVLLSLLVGCSTLGPSYYDMAKPTIKSDDALVHLYRVGKPIPGSVEILIDEVAVANLADKGFTYVYVKPGKRKITVQWPFMQKPLFEGGHFDPKTLTVELEAGKSYYFNYSVKESAQDYSSSEKFLVESGIVGVFGKALVKSRIESAGLVQESENEGLYKMSIGHYQRHE